MVFGAVHRNEMAGVERGPFLQCPARCKAAYIFEKHRRRDLGSTSSRRSRIRVSAWRLLRRSRHAEKGAEIPRHHGILAAPDVSVEPQRRRRLEGEHGKARHQAVGKGHAAGFDRGSGMPSKCFRIVSGIPGIERCLRKEFVTVFAWFASQWPVPGKKSPGVYEKSF